MWGSLMVGIMPNMRHSLEWSDLLMQKFFEIVPSHTIEPFSLSETLLRNYKFYSLVFYYSYHTKYPYLRLDQ